MTTPPPDSAPEIAAALDQLLTQAATGPVRRLLPARCRGAAWSWPYAPRSVGMATDRLSTLPVGPLGSSSTSHTWRGYL
jgi:hypothetical protein